MGDRRRLTVVTVTIFRLCLAHLLEKVSYTLRCRPGWPPLATSLLDKASYTLCCCPCWLSLATRLVENSSYILRCRPCWLPLATSCRALHTRQWKHLAPDGTEKT